MLIKNCSGGQQRRISLAVTLIHDPELLILDEPTVGLDSLLRERIWNHFTKLTNVKNVTILMSTHYIEEAKQSHQVGLLRKGRLLAEDSPRKIMRTCGTNHMDEVFLRLSRKQSTGAECLVRRRIRSEKPSEPKPSNLKPNQQKILTALLTKLYLSYSRNIWFSFVYSFVPVIMCLLIHFAIGTKLRGLVLGVVNNEVTNYSDCLKASTKTVTVQRHECVVHMLSCRFLEEFDQKFAKLVRT
jgi:ABC-type proline/glycine betaine transport system ATPase subunit